jgi:hypothetical protein
MMDKKIHALCSLPRSGSTLMCNVLNSNPRFFASDTSRVAMTVHGLTATMTHSEEFKSELAKGEVTHRRLREAARGFVHGWYGVREEPVIFDKDRSNSWMFQHDVFHHLFPEGKMVILVRDPREVLASILRQQAVDPMVRTSSDLGGRTVYSIAEALFQPQGLVGSAILAIENLIRLGTAPGSVVDEYTLWIQYERFVAQPKPMLDLIHQELGEDPFDYDVDHVERVSADQDERYLGLFPHEGFGKIEPREPTWPRVVPADIAEAVVQRYPLFSKTFQYT